MADEFQTKHGNLFLIFPEKIIKTKYNNDKVKDYTFSSYIECNGTNLLDQFHSYEIEEGIQNEWDKLIVFEFLIKESPLQSQTTKLKYADEK